MKKFEGIIPYLISPVDSDGNVKQNELIRLSVDLAKKGITGLCVLGSAGEFAYLNGYQKAAIIEAAVEAGRRCSIPVIAGISGFSEAQAIQEARTAVDLGAEALVLMIEEYFPLTPEMQSHFVHSICDAVPDTEVMLYMNPKYMHASFSLKFFTLVEDCPNVNYYKDASGNTGFLLSLINQFGDRFKVFSASSHIPLSVFTIGGVGWMSAPACVIPDAAVCLYSFFKEGRMEEAVALQKKLWWINSAIATYDIVPCIKGILNHDGYDVGDPILPLKALSDEIIDKLMVNVRSLREEVVV